MVAINTEPPKPASSMAGIHASRYARDRRELIGLINSMRACGVATELDLPRVAIIGNQSAGKSSLVEAISGIKVPRDAGTCTRCPFEVRLQQSEEAWRCQISLRFETDDENGRPHDKISEISFGNLIRDPNEVEGALRRAQLAILNPSVAPADWVKSSDDDVKKAKEGLLVLGSKKQLSFSTNLICIDISGPETTDLAFLDLPGIISNVDEGEDEANIDLIKNLVTRTIDGNCLILLTLSMRDDIENQSAMKLAREADRDGKRTIGVLTKPDTLQEGEYDRWLQVLRGERARLSNGYFVTKQPGAADLGKNLSFAAAREAEKNFFSSQDPWASLPQDLRRRLGTPSLTEYLSDKLSSYIKQKLPDIRQTVADALSTAETSLSNLPAPPSEDPSGELIRLFTNFRHDLDSYVRGSLGYEDLLQQMKFVSSTFASNIRATAPRFHPFTDDDFNLPDTSTVVLKDLTDSRGSRNLCDGKSMTRFLLDMDVGDVRRYLQSRKTRETPLNSPFGAKAGLMVETTKGWNALSLNALEAVRGPVTDTLKALVEKYFGRYTESGLKSFVLDIVVTVVEKLVQACRHSLLHLLEAERSPFTENEEYYRSVKEQAFAKFTERRRTTTNLKNPSKVTAEHLRSALSSLNAAGIVVKQEDLAKLFPSDEYAEELDAMAHVVANFQVAYKRLIDNVPRYIDLDIIRELPGSISDAFVSSINYRDSNIAARLLSEGFEVQEERAELTKRIQRIGDAKTLLSSFGRE